MINKEKISRAKEIVKKYYHVENIILQPEFLEKAGIIDLKVGYFLNKECDLAQPGIKFITSTGYLLITGFNMPRDILIDYVNGTYKRYPCSGYGEKDGVGDAIEEALSQGDIHMVITLALEVINDRRRKE
jgi:hypothetical protein